MFADPVPAAIRRQSLEADRIAREAGIANVPDPPPGSESPADSTVEPGAGSPATSSAPSGDSVGAETAPDSLLAPSPAAPNAATTAPASVPPQAPTSQPTIDWQQRYNTLRGKYDAEIPDLQAQLRAMNQALAAVQQAQAQHQPAQHPPTQAPPRETSFASEIAAEDREAYGDELIGKTQHWAEVRLMPKLAQLERRLIEVEGRSHQASENSAKSQVEARMDRDMPGWQDVNNDPAFWTWLSQPDPFSGNIRRALLTDAHARGDAARTLAFFKAFLREHTAVDPGAGTQPNQTFSAPPSAAPAADRLPLEALAAPGRGTTSLAAPGAPEKRTWTPAQVSALYREKTEGRWYGRDDDFYRLEQDMIAATREGRFRS